MSRSCQGQLAIATSATRRANQQKPVQPLLQKYSDFPNIQITCITFLVLSHRGAARDRHGRGTGCGGRERRQRRGRLTRGRRSRVVLTPRCWRQVRGRQLPPMTVARKPVTGESSKEPVKTIARGMPGDFRCDLTNACAQHPLPLHTRLSGASGARHSLRPPIGEGGTRRPKLARQARRGREAVVV